jgi:hypothetical protein
VLPPPDVLLLLLLAVLPPPDVLPLPRLPVLPLPVVLKHSSPLIKIKYIYYISIIYMSRTFKRRQRKRISSNKRGGKPRTVKTTNNKPSAKWQTAVGAADETLRKTGSLSKARVVLRKQALSNARQIFGQIGSQL